MKRAGLSIKARITLWYAALMMIICAAALLCLALMSVHAQKTYCRDTLESARVVILDEMEIEHGLLEIDSDIDEVPNVYAALFDLQGGLIYGRKRVDAPFEAGEMRSMDGGGHRWVILDERIDVQGYEPVWLRLHLSADLSKGVAQALVMQGLWMLALLSLVALWGGYRITRRALRPVGEMSKVAAAIARSGSPSARVREYAGGGDELHALSDTFNEMLDRLEAAFELERRFASDAAHELRTPLNAMAAQGEYALSRSTAEEKDEAILKMLGKNEEMRQLVDQLLMITRLDAGQVPMESKVALGQLVAGVAEDLEPVAAERGIHLVTSLSSLTVRGNRAMLTRVLVNLTDNAIRYGREGGCVRLALLEEEECAVIRVEDDGEGIAPDALEHVFERFWRGDSARSTQGTGIGLAIVHAAVRAHGGSVSVQSTLGEGSCFTIRLPKE